MFIKLELQDIQESAEDARKQGGAGYPCAICLEITATPQSLTHINK